jgi:PAS domain S-box-containing protein
MVGSIVLVALYLAATPWLITSIGYSNAVVAPVALILAWMWGRAAGAALAMAASVANFYWAEFLGSSGGSTPVVVVDVLAITAVAALVGHIGMVLEHALGARARSDQAYTALEVAARERMLTITDQVPVGLYRTTPDGKIMGGNDALIRILGYADRKALLDANVWDHYVRAKDRRQQMETPDTGEGSWREFELRKADGTRIWVRDWARGVLASDGEAGHFDGVLEDITEKRTANERFRAAFEEAPIGMTISGVDGRMVKGNLAAAELLGRTLEELEGLQASEYSHEDDSEKTTAALEKLAEGQTVRYEKRLRRPDGSVIWALVTHAPIYEGEGSLKHFISHVIDITERHQAGEALENLVRSKDELIASVSHELRTPLTVVHGLAQELEEGWLAFSVPEQKEFIGLIAQQSAEVAHIVEDLLVAARADIGMLPIHVESVDLLDQVEKTLSAVPELEVEITRAGDMTPAAFADGPRVRQIVRNLLSNAQRYGGPVVTVRCGASGSVAWIEVADDGDGVPEEDKARIFEPYRRAHNAEGQPSSVGLGLTVSMKLAELMGGSLGYRHEPGATIFRLELPGAGSVHVATAAAIPGS